MEVRLILENLDEIVFPKEYVQSINLQDIKESMMYENYFDEPHFFKTVERFNLVVKYDENLTFRGMDGEYYKVFERLKYKDITSVIINNEYYYVQYEEENEDVIGSDNLLQRNEKYYDEFEDETVFSITIGKEE